MLLVLFIWIQKILSSMDPPPFFSQDIWISFRKRGKRKYNSAFPQVPSPHPKRFVNKEERMVLNFVFWLSQRLWLEVGLTWEWKELFLVGNFVYESLLCEASCSFMSFPRGTCLLGGTSHSCLSLVWRCHLHFSANGCSLWLQDGARPCCTELLWPLGLGQRSAGALACAGSQLRCWCAWLCLTLAGLVGLLSGFAFFPASASNLFTPNTSLIEVIVSVLLWNRMAGVCSLPCGHTWVIWPLTSQLITTFKTTKQCWGSRLGLYWWTRW